MGIIGIDHLGIAVGSLDEAVAFYRECLGLEFLGFEEVPSQKVRVAMFAAGSSRIELLEPTSPESPVAKFLEKKGPGMHHVAYSVDSADEQVASLLDRGVRMIDAVPREGAGGSRIAFVHPASSGGVLTELCEHGREGEKSST